MTVRSRLNRIQRRLAEGCAACRGRRVVVTTFEPGGWIPKPPPLYIKPLAGAAERASPICSVCGRDCSLRLLVRHGGRTPPPPESSLTVPLQDDRPRNGAGDCHGVDG